MINIPKTKEEARNYRYGEWRGVPKGVPYKENRCAMEIPSGWLFKQCSRKPVTGELFCRQHLKRTAAPSANDKE
jgi:hypothetical protein